jgi:nucleoid-associated protein YgaU
MPRYRKTKKFSNSGEYYAYLRRKRNLKKVIHYETPTLYNPSVVDRALIVTNTHIWKYGDRYYKLSHQYYGNPKYWWIIAWYNGAPTEANLATGDLIEIPVDLESALKVLGV